jgi:hypothetical protein
MQILEISLRNLSDAREGGRAEGSTLAHFGGLALPIGLSIRNFRPGYFQGAFALDRLEGLQLHPVPFRKFPGRRGEVLFRPTRIAHLPWREQEN